MVFLDCFKFWYSFAVDFFLVVWFFEFEVKVDFILGVAYDLVVFIFIHNLREGNL
jgi:hypothetical protein